MKRPPWHLIGYLVLCGGVAWALVSVDATADEAHSTATAFADAERREEAEDAIEAFEACKVRNRATLNGRERFVTLRNNLIAVLDPEDQAAIEALFRGIPLDAEQEDRDCDGDNRLTEEDYAP